MSSHERDQLMSPPSGEIKSRLQVSSGSSYEEDVPEDEARMVATSRSVAVEDDKEWTAKTKKVRDRPWKKATAYDSLQADDLDVIGVHRSSSKGDDDNKSYGKPKGQDNNDDDDCSSSSGSSSSDSDSDGDSKSEDDDDVDNDDLPPRWKNKSSEKEVQDAHLRAVSQASHKVAHAERLRMGNERLARVSNHNQVRMEALKLLEAADSQSLRRDGITGSVQGGYDGSSKGGGLKGLRALAGGLEHRQPKYERVNLNHGSGSGDDFVTNPPDQMEDVNFDGTPDGNDNSNSNGEGENGEKKWGSRYSIDRHLRALNGGMSSQQALNKMKRDHYNQLNQNTSATNMCKTSPHEDDDDRWNVSHGQRGSPSQSSTAGSMWNTVVTAVKEGVSHASRVLSPDRDRNTTYGSHRWADHSSPRTGIFTGVALTSFLDRLSPTSKARAEAGRSSFGWNSVNLNEAPNHLRGMSFTAHDDHIYERQQMQQRRKKMFWTGVIMLIFVGIIGIIGVTVHTAKIRDARSRRPTYYDVGQEIQFYVMSDIPVNDADKVKLTRELGNLHPRDGDFVIHLGDINKASSTLCTFSVYDGIATLLKKSPIPVLVLPGDNDWNDCPMPDAAFDYWLEKMNRFEENFDEKTFPTVPVVERQLGREENFAFLTKGVLFIGLNLVDGTVQSEREWSVRHQENLQWVEEQLDSYDVTEYRAIVLLGHAGYTGKVGDFFWPVIEDFKRANKPVLYLHANDGEGMLEYTPVDNFRKFTALRLEKGSIVAPTQITVKNGAQPFEIKSSKEKN